ncbi:hypothetical protein GH714_023323 [Hevea brasiliensis]|uniref:Uncharacterized protein n=1 Tax=Hevea brasiliensis TaxID=3981 RepID=A0A6A6LMK5_HEVBR|nr:hypothetical protein GH714_023323 [Hevea brasiliensis]
MRSGTEDDRVSFVALGSGLAQQHLFMHSRKKYGLLEKHKNYVIRAKVFHEKEETLGGGKELKSWSSENKIVSAFGDVPGDIKRKTASSYRELEARKNRVNLLEKLYGIAEGITAEGIDEPLDLVE